MTPSSEGPVLTPAEREAADRLLARVARSREGIEQTLDLVDYLTESGVLAAASGFFEDFDENFSAVTRPDLMTMAANLMMILGALGQVDYRPFFDLVMQCAPAFNEAYPAYRERTEKLTLHEAVSLLRTPEMAGALEMLVAILKAPRQPEADAGKE